ncbi:MAG: protealysin inhibitor emfourin [Vicinamibacterales bacterium]
MQIRKLRFRMSGGFAGLVRGTEVEGSALSAAERAALERWAKASATARSDAARDQMMYEWDLDTDSGPHHLECDELNVPDGLDGLAARLVKQSHPVAL